MQQDYDSQTQNRQISDENLQKNLEETCSFAFQFELAELIKQSFESVSQEFIYKPLQDMTKNFASVKEKQSKANFKRYAKIEKQAKMELGILE